MLEPDLILMSLVIFIPSLFALGLLFFPKGRDEAMRWWTLFGTAVTLGVSLCMFIDCSRTTLLDFHGVMPNKDNRAKATLVIAPIRPISPRSARSPLSNDWVGRDSLDPALQHRLLPRRRRHQHAAGPADHRALASWP